MVRRGVRQHSMVQVRVSKIANLFGPRGVRYFAWSVVDGMKKIDYVIVEKFYE